MKERYCFPSEAFGLISRQANSASVIKLVEAPIGQTWAILTQYGIVSFFVIVTETKVKSGIKNAKIGIFRYYSIKL